MKGHVGGMMWLIKGHVGSIVCLSKRQVGSSVFNYGTRWEYSVFN